jgi:hypothetical protein
MNGKRGMGTCNVVGNKRKEYAQRMNGKKGQGNVKGNKRKGHVQRMNGKKGMGTCNGVGRSKKRCSELEQRKTQVLLCISKEGQGWCMLG